MIQNKTKEKSQLLMSIFASTKFVIKLKDYNNKFT